ncbi:MAG TPA: pyridoxal-phosphate dependent enzyme [Natronosporangium sp.]
MVNATSQLPQQTDLEAAAAWLADRVVATPVVRSPALDRIAGATLWLKAENLQTTGSYKYRGATLAVDRLARAGDCPGVIAQSTGNHGLAVATAAQAYGLAATVVLPIDAPLTKVRRIEATGAQVMRVGTTVEERLAVVERLRAESGYRLVDAYDHPDVIAGQGTAALELIEAAQRQGVALDAVVVPVGGGGGVAGACLAAAGRDLAVYGVEPVGCDSLRRSLKEGRRVTVPPAQTLADGLRPSCVGELPFRIAYGTVAGVVRVDDRAIARALCLALFHTALLLEPAAAAGLAGAFRLAAAGAFHQIGVVLTGGNIEPAGLARLLTEHVAAERRIVL